MRVRGGVGQGNPLRICNSGCLAPCGGQGAEELWKASRMVLGFLYGGNFESRGMTFKFVSCRHVGPLLFPYHFI